MIIISATRVINVMTWYFVDKFLNRKKKIRKIIKFSSVVIFVALFLMFVLRIINVFILNSAIKNVVNDFVANQDHKVKYEKKLNFLSSNIVMQNITIDVNTGSIKIGELSVSKKCGFILPKEILVVPKGIHSSVVNGKEYDILTKSQGPELVIILNRHFFKKPTFGGIRIERPEDFIFVEKQSEIGKISIERMNFVMNDSFSAIDYKGNMIFHDGDVIPHVILLDKPFKWEIKLAEHKTKTKKIQPSSSSSENETVSNAVIEKIYLDFDFSKIYLQGKSKYGEKLYTTDSRMEIVNENKFVDAFFNMILQSRGSNDAKTLENVCTKVKKNILPLLKKQSKFSTKDKLVLLLKKNETDNDVSVNGISMTDIITKLAQ